ncbi:LacI family DNA-binding transcriptional regulator [Paramicrobacterium agarici]|uniref:LacI family transcriptional regulator n=1 Tax=Paramicrobacterium agarici TaxID=630514 RepID=A0A2A9DV60_9MICO|nr:LacI family DNA-binding transcriptional regulator [Microbacterium agarici]PFG29872.1 LacI family transcriptional regulator [Microbacterium agarici]
MESKHSPKRATIGDVASRAGVSIKTVSRVVNGVMTVNPDLAARVRAAAAELSYRANPAAFALRTGASFRTIGLLIKDLSNDFYATIASAVADVARAHGAQLITAHAGENTADELAVVRDLVSRRLDGLLIVPTSGDHAALAREIDPHIPVVYLDRRPEGINADSVVIDNANGARDAVTTLINDGHVRIAGLFDTLNMPTMRERLAGFREAFAQAGVDHDGRLIVTNLSTPDSAFSATSSMLALESPPTAYFCGNNRSGIGALRALWVHERIDPLVTFDDFELSDLMPRRFSIVKYDKHSIGRLGAELLFRRISGDQHEPQSIVLPTQIEKRGVAK